MTGTRKHQIKRGASLLLGVAALAALGSNAWAGVNIRAHRAVYDLKLERSSEGSNISGADGRMKGDEEKIREGGCEAYISKPISVMSFLKTVDSFLKGPQ